MGVDRMVKSFMGNLSIIQFMEAGSFCGHAFFAPFDQVSIGILNTDGSSFSELMGLPAPTHKWAGIVAVPGGKMYAPPFNETTILEITHGTAGTWPEKFYYTAYFNTFQ